LFDAAKKAAEDFEEKDDGMGRIPAAVHDVRTFKESELGSGPAFSIHFAAGGKSSDFVAAANLFRC
jgi:hypothetical protein